MTVQKIIIAGLLLLATGCASLQTPQQTNVAVSALLDEIQIAINEIAARTADGSSLPPFRNAEVKLSTRASVKTEGSASLVLSGETNRTTTDSNLLTLELVPNPDLPMPLAKGTGHDIANYVIAAVSAVDQRNFLKLKTLTVEAGLQVSQTSAGGIDVELVGISFKGGLSGETTNSHSLKLIFAHPKPEEG